ncbi:MAG: ExbD/TolR family protein [Alphaproteobacteria bacterium]|jgi:biopolymer transport protein TolR
MGGGIKFSARGRRHQGSFSEINVTPMVDVMLVLLVIFMVTAPMLTTGISLDLPRGDGQAIEDSDRAVDISIDARSRIYLGGETVKPDALVKRLKAMQKSNPNLKIVISGDKATSYGQVIELMSLLRMAGISKVGLKTGDLLDTEIVKPKPAPKKGK